MDPGDLDPDSDPDPPDYGVRRREGGREPRDGAAHNQRQGTRWQKMGITDKR